MQGLVSGGGGGTGRWEDVQGKVGWVGRQKVRLEGREGGKRTRKPWQEGTSDGARQSVVR